MSPELASSDRSASQCRISSAARQAPCTRSEEHTSELQSQSNLVCRLLLEKKRISTEELQSLVACLKTTLSSLESDAHRLYLLGSSYEEMAEAHAFDTKTIDN